MGSLIQDLRLPIAIIGLGKSGESAYQLLVNAGIAGESLLKFDEKNLNYGLTLKDFFLKNSPPTILVSPGVPLSKPEFKRAAENGARITSELELAASFLENETVICVTGSIGKSTVTSIIGEGLSSLDANIFVGGNLGTPLADYVNSLLLQKRQRARYVVLELSSYQLENFNNLKSNLSVFTFLAPNHLERYSSLEDYYKTKLTLIPKTSGRVVANSSGGDCKKYLEIHSKVIWTDRRSPAFQSHLSERPALLGEHNRDNLALAFAVFEELHCPPSVFEKALRFKGLSHRLENLGERSNILFINDSKATAMDSTIQACESIRRQFPQRNIITLLGGKDKDMPWHQLSCLNSLNLQYVFFGEVGAKAKLESGLTGAVFPTLREALDNLKPLLQSGDVVLLSPGGTSLDEFKNFEDRGDFFRAWVNRL